MTTKFVRLPNPTLAVRLSAKAERKPNGCLEWTGYCDEESGYGKIANRPGPPLSTHVAAWIIEHGPIPLGQQVRHKCDNPPCMDTEHLELGTAADNINDRMVRGRFVDWRADITVCGEGHEYDSVDSEGYRCCSICRDGRRAKYAQARRDARPVCPGCQGEWSGVDKVGRRYCAPCKSRKQTVINLQKSGVIDSDCIEVLT